MALCQYATTGRDSKQDQNSYQGVVARKNVQASVSEMCSACWCGMMSNTHTHTQTHTHQPTLINLQLVILGHRRAVQQKQQRCPGGCGVCVSIGLFTKKALQFAAMSSMWDTIDEQLPGSFYLCVTSARVHTPHRHGCQP